MYSSYIFKRITQDLICRLCMHKLYETKTENKGLYCQHIDSASRRKQGSTAINKMRVKKAQQLMISKSRLFPDFQSILLIFQTFSSLKSCVSNSRLFPDFQTSVRTLISTSGDLCLFDIVIQTVDAHQLQVICVVPIKMLPR